LPESSGEAARHAATDTVTRKSSESWRRLRQRTPGERVDTGVLGACGERPSGVSSTSTGPGSGSSGAVDQLLRGRAFFRIRTASSDVSVLRRREGVGQRETGVGPGFSDLQVLLAVWNAGALSLILLRQTRLGLGSGKVGRPCERMQRATSVRRRAFGLRAVGDCSPEGSGPACVVGGLVGRVVGSRSLPGPRLIWIAMAPLGWWWGREVVDGRGCACTANTRELGQRSPGDAVDWLLVFDPLGSPAVRAAPATSARCEQRRDRRACV